MSCFDCKAKQRLANCVSGCKQIHEDNSDLWTPKKTTYTVKWIALWKEPCFLQCVALTVCIFPPQLPNIDCEVDIWHTNIDCWQCVGAPVIWRSHSTLVTLLQLSEGMADKARGIFYKALQHIPWVKVSSHTQFCPARHLHIMLDVYSSQPIFFCCFSSLLFLKCCNKHLCVQGFFLDGVQLFPEHMQEFVDLMTEKELRVRLPLEELDILLE